VAKQLFGTDGIRAAAGEYPLDRETIYAFGVALGRDAAATRSEPEIVIGSDTRESGPWIAEMVAGGLQAAGARVRYAGVITTPGVAWITRTGPFVAGVMISASHNPFSDNGIKVFGHSGFKLPDSEEHEIEQRILELRESGVTPQPVALSEDASVGRGYLDYLVSTIAVRFDGLRIALDCGNGASYRLAPELFRRLGATVTATCCEPDGRNINLNCGALHVENLRETVLATGADFGVAFDGDADRSVFVSRSGRIVNGDGTLLAMGRALHAAGKLPGDTLVSTVMSNLGLERALQASGIRMVRAAVGDKYVLEEMVRLGSSLGGEQSGHVIFREWATTGDGMLTALKLFEAAHTAGTGLDELTADLKLYPQRLVNIRVREKGQLTEIPSVAAEIKRVTDAFGDAGRVLVRFSGTEPLARVMVEGPDLQQVNDFSDRIAEAIRREVGL
jgi:phosphoglucosamine mutase